MSTRSSRHVAGFPTPAAWLELDAIDRPRQGYRTSSFIDDLGKLGLIYCESDVETADVENVIEDLLDGQCF